MPPDSTSLPSTIPNLTSFSPPSSTPSTFLPATFSSFATTDSLRKNSIPLPSNFPAIPFLFRTESALFLPPAMPSSPPPTMAFLPTIPRKPTPKMPISSGTIVPAKNLHSLLTCSSPPRPFLPTALPSLSVAVPPTSGSQESGTWIFSAAPRSPSRRDTAPAPSGLPMAKPSSSPVSSLLPPTSHKFIKSVPPAVALKKPSSASTALPSALPLFAAMAKPFSSLARQRQMLLIAVCGLFLSPAIPNPSRSSPTISARLARLFLLIVIGSLTKTAPPATAKSPSSISPTALAAIKSPRPAASIPSGVTMAKNVSSTPPATVPSPPSPWPNTARNSP